MSVITVSSLASLLAKHDFESRPVKTIPIWHGYISAERNSIHDKSIAIRLYPNEPTGLPPIGEGVLQGSPSQWQVILLTILGKGVLSEWRRMHYVHQVIEHHNWRHAVLGNAYKAFLKLQAHEVDKWFPLEYPEQVAYLQRQLKVVFRFDGPAMLKAKDPYPEVLGLLPHGYPVPRYPEPNKVIDETEVEEWLRRLNKTDEELKEYKKR